MSKRTISLVMIVVGGAIAVVALLADVIGFGDSSGIGLQQALGIAIGVILAIVGIGLALSKPKAT